MGASRVIGWRKVKALICNDSAGPESLPSALHRLPRTSTADLLS